MKIREKLENYLFDTNLRWSFIHTKIINKLPITTDQYDEYFEAINKLEALFKQEPSIPIKEVEKIIGEDDLVAESWGLNEALEKVDKPKAKNDLRKEQRAKLKAYLKGVKK